MDWTKLIADIMKAGVAQTVIAKQCGVAQSTISDLHRGATKSPAYELGRKLISLHAAGGQPNPSELMLGSCARPLPDPGCPAASQPLETPHAA